uniref:Uncharacterized protein n=1 Tax=Heterorhabditis bacteriophora TaxID=37862 RepID=A0A1I7XQ28_HETBA
MLAPIITKDMKLFPARPLPPGIKNVGNWKYIYIYIFESSSMKSTPVEPSKSDDDNRTRYKMDKTDCGKENGNGNVKEEGTESNGNSEKKEKKGVVKWLTSAFRKSSKEKDSSICRYYDRALNFPIKVCSIPLTVMTYSFRFQFIDSLYYTLYAIVLLE